MQVAIRSDRQVARVSKQGKPMENHQKQEKTKQPQRPINSAVLLNLFFGAFGVCVLGSVLGDFFFVVFGDALQACLWCFALM